ncbi:hypothetical protein ACJRO7_018318 [Eucalyptus globulus]|uniref:Late embryogenesis abundant protein LEA-2 subgroup domain-containing protein n=1 Tax=Eucalyptus globulus TaxID=34317 RepID=A0ABD3KU53_EUCGL
MEKNQQVDPLAPTGGQYPRSDQESLSNNTEQEKRQKRLKWAAYIAAFAVFQVIVILVFVLVIMKVHTPKFRIGMPRIEPGTQQSLVNSTGSIFKATLVAPIRLKNANFGPYKYDSTTVFFKYDDTIVGEVNITKGKANFKSTKKFDAKVTVDSNPLSETSKSRLGNDLLAGNLTLTSSANLNGKVELMLIFKKKKSTSMDCTMTIAGETVQSVTCE